MRITCIVYTQYLRSTLLRERGGGDKIQSTNIKSGQSNYVLRVFCFRLDRPPALFSLSCISITTSPSLQSSVTNPIQTLPQSCPLLDSDARHEETPPGEQNTATK